MNHDDLGSVFQKHTFAGRFLVAYRTTAFQPRVDLRKNNSLEINCDVLKAYATKFYGSTMWYTLCTTIELFSRHL